MADVVGTRKSEGSVPRCSLFLSGFQGSRDWTSPEGEDADDREVYGIQGTCPQLLANLVLGQLAGRLVVFSKGITALSFPIQQMLLVECFLPSSRCVLMGLLKV